VRRRDLAQNSNSLAAAIQAGVARHGSTMIAGDLVLFAAKIAFTASTSLNGATMVCDVNAAGTPALSGWRRQRAAARLDSSESTWP